MQFPDRLTKYSGPSGSRSQSESVSYDYSGADEIRKRKDAAGELGTSKWKALYDGDVSGSIESGRRIRDLMDSIKSIQPVRVASISSSSNSSNSGDSLEGYHGRDVTPPPAAPSLARGAPNLAGNARPMNARNGFIV